MKAPDEVTGSRRRCSRSVPKSMPLHPLERREASQLCAFPLVVHDQRYAWSGPVPAYERSHSGHIAEMHRAYDDWIDRDRTECRPGSATSARRPDRRLAVDLVRWPAGASHRAALAELGIPRLLIVEDGNQPPEIHADEDWCWASSDERDVAARLARLCRDATGAGVPVLDRDQSGILGLLFGPAGDGQL